MSFYQRIKYIAMAGVLIGLQACTGIFDSAYDEPVDPATRGSGTGQLYVDASHWGKWHYIDLPGVASASETGPDSQNAWISIDIPMPTEPTPTTPTKGESGIYTYWYDVFGAGISVNEFRNFSPTDSQPEPETWTLAVHRNNVRTNGCLVAKTDCKDIDMVRTDADYLNTLVFEGDTWSESDVWCDQSRMLSGLIGNQGIAINQVLGEWLQVDIPPMPPSFTLCDNVFLLQLPDNTLAAVQLENYQSPSGVKCCLTINYRYPL